MDAQLTVERKIGGFSYFMVRLHHGGTDGRPDLEGLVERLGSGEKQSFATGEELLRLLGLWVDVQR